MDADIGVKALSSQSLNELGWYGMAEAMP